ncbi:LOW QUALITY PROTEIN: hypothetical protein V2J09_021051 [Rumex salicifolius]
MGNRMKARIEGIGTYRLILDTGCHVDLEECLYVPECARNLVSISRLDNLEFNVKFGHGGFSLYRNNYFYGSGTLFDSLYRFNLDTKFVESLFNIESQGIKRSASNESSAFLWHQRLGHISKERMMSTRIVETGNARFIENGQTSGSNVPRKVDIQEIHVKVPLSLLSQLYHHSQMTRWNNLMMCKSHKLIPINEPVTIQEEYSVPQESLRRSTREKKICHS